MTSHDDLAQLGELDRGKQDALSGLSGSADSARTWWADPLGEWYSVEPIEPRSMTLAEYMRHVWRSIVRPPKVVEYRRKFWSRSAEKIMRTSVEDDIRATIMSHDAFALPPGATQSAQEAARSGDIGPDSAAAGRIAPRARSKKSGSSWPRALRLVSAIDRRPRFGDGPTVITAAGAWRFLKARGASNAAGFRL